jgi:hypothetical protein
MEYSFETRAMLLTLLGITPAFFEWLQKEVLSNKQTPMAIINEIIYDVTFVLAASTVPGREQYWMHSSENELLTVMQHLTKVQYDKMKCNCVSSYLVLQERPFRWAAPNARLPTVRRMKCSWMRHSVTVFVVPHGSARSFKRWWILFQLSVQGSHIQLEACEISGSHGGEYEDDCLMGYLAV